MHRSPGSLIPFAWTIFLSAFLLFQVQPMIARIILPWFGGSAAVWTACMLFFQTALLVGYLYAHLSTTGLPVRIQAWSHAALLVASLLLLPVLPHGSWKPTGAGNPTLQILAVLAATVGIPYFLLSTTGPLVQAWYGRSRSTAPYRLYALSNLGSMLALLSYPVLVEPLVGTRAQAYGWSVAYAVFALSTAALALANRNAPPAPTPTSRPEQAPGRRVRILWLALPACASALLLSVTTYLTQNLAAIPFLWVLPLCLYLLSFIICFDRAAWYLRRSCFVLLAAALSGMTWAVWPDRGLDSYRQLLAMFALFGAGLFLACMVCHGELVRLKPHPRHLTGFYLMIALGGALGGLFAGLAAPYLFKGEYELPIAMACCALLAASRMFSADPPFRRRGLAWVAGTLAVVLTAALGLGLRAGAAGYGAVVRNFYGTLRTFDSGQGKDALRSLQNGTIIHGEQYLAPDRARQATTYYGPGTGIGLALASLAPGARLGFIGLGAGTLAAYGRPGDVCRFYEINPLVLTMARTQFTFLRDCRARLELSLGDARLSLEREPAQDFDLLAVDAFSGDAIPVHLLTLEAFQLYFRHLKPGGILAVHISNRYLDLAPVVARAAQALGKAALLVDTDDDDAHDVYAATWILVSGDRRRFAAAPFKAAGTPLQGRPGFRLWTDDYSNLFSVLD